MQYLVIGVRCLLGLVFLASVISKVAGAGAFDAFLTSLRGMSVLPPALARAAAWGVVLGEGGVCGLLAVPEPWAAVGGFAIAAGLLAMFACGIALSTRQGVHVPCRCFGASTVPLGRPHVARNVVLAGLAVLGETCAQADGTVQAGGAVLAVCAGLLFGGLVVRFDDLLELFWSGDSGPSTRASGTPAAFPEQ